MNTSKEGDTECLPVTLIIKSEEGTQKKLTKLPKRSKLSEIKKALKLDSEFEYKFLNANGAEVDEDLFSFVEFLSNKKEPALNINEDEKTIAELHHRQPRKPKEAAKIEFSERPAPPSQNINHIKASPRDNSQEATVISKAKNYWDMTQLPIEQVQLLLKNSKYNFGYTPIIGYARKPIFEVNWDLFNKNDIYNNYPAKTECFWESSKKDVETIKFGHHEALAQINDFRINIDGSFKYSKENQTGTIFEKDYFYAEYLIPKGSYNLTHLCVKKLPAFENFFEKDNLNRWIVTEEKVKQFIQDYGLFFPTEVVFGGKRFIEETVSKTGNFEGEKKSIEAQAKVALGIVDAGVRTGNGTNQIDATGTHTRKLVVQSLGGLPEKQGNPEEWLTGLIENPQSCAVIKMTGLQFTYELLEKDLRQAISSFLKTFPEEEQKIEEVKKKMESGRDFLSGEKKESKEVGQVPVKESEVRDIDSYTKEALVLSKQRPIEYKVDDLACGAKRISYFSQTIAHIFIGAAVPFLNLLPIDTPKAATKLLSNKIIVYFDRDGNKCSNEKEAIEKSVR